MSELDIFDGDEYLNFVADKLRIGRGTAVHYAQAATTVLNETVTTGELSDGLSQLPDEYGVLFEPSVT